MTAQTVVPTRATAVLAATMIATARREGSGAEAAILHLDQLAPGQCAALVGLLLAVAAEMPMTVIVEARAPAVEHCLDCGAGDDGRPRRRGLCDTCYQRHYYRQTLWQFEPRMPRRPHIQEAS